MKRRERKYFDRKKRVVFIKNVVRELIHVGGKPIDLDFFSSLV